MDNFEGTYAPQSPDLSNYHSYDQPSTFNEPYSPPIQTSNNYQNFHQQPQEQQPLFDPFNPDQSTTFSYPPQPQPPPEIAMPKPRKSKTQRGDDEFVPGQTQPKQGRQTKKHKAEEAVCSIPAPGTAENVVVSTKFPVARIKRIMQADEDVGKVSQVTPTAVSKALELFIISLTLKSSAVARSKSSKRVTAAHLKQAVVGDEQMDFLEQIVSKVPDAPTSTKPEGKRKGAATEEEDSSDDAYIEARPKKKSVAVRKKRVKGGDD